jgi:hypothetical protein
MFLTKVQKVIATSEKMDMLVDRAVHTIKDMWEKESDRKMSNDEMYRLNDLLSSFFSGFKYDWFGRDEE